MKLRTRITFSYGYLVTLLLLSAAGAALAFQQLGHSIGRILDENFASVQSSMLMLEAMERQDSAVLSLLLGDESKRVLLSSSEETFQAALNQAADNITLPAEHAAIEEIRGAFDAYRNSRDRLLEAAHEHPLLDYDQETFPRFESVKRSIMDLLDLNHEAMQAADRQAQRRAVERAILLGCLVALALLSLVLINHRLNRDLLLRLSELQSFAAGLARGDQRRSLLSGTQDELGALANSLNEIMKRQVEAEGRSHARQSGYREVILGMMDSLPQAAVLTNRAAEVMASKLDEIETARIARALRFLSEDAWDRRDGFKLPVRGVAGPVTARPLWAAGLRPVGWLAVKGGPAGEAPAGRSENGPAARREE